MLGIEFRDSSVLAVIVGDDGRVLSRAEVPHGASRVLGDAALDAIGRVADPASPQVLGGVASFAPESPACAAAVQVLASRYGGAFAREGAVGSGTAAAVAETWIGAARGARDAVFFAAADHITAGIVRNGEPVTGVHRRAPAVAWLSLNPVEREDYRKTGCLEAEAAAAGIVRRLVWRVKAGDHSRVQDAVGGDLSAITAEHVLQAAREGDGVAISVMRDTAKYLGMAAANLVVLSDPGTLVVGGIMASAADLLMEPLRTEIARRLPAPMMDALTIAPAMLGGDGAAIGAARLAAAVLR